MSQVNYGPSYWKGRWERKETGWHQVKPEPHMVSFFTGLKPTRVFVPLCGKSNDLLWLMGQGHDVVGVELSELACQSFFEESKIPFQKINSNGSIIYQGDQITIINQDIFSITSELLGTLGAIYDRAALIALPQDQRAQYADQMVALVQKCTDTSLKYLQIVLQRNPPDLEGPPFSVSQEELNSLYGAAFEVVPVSREFESQNEKGQTEECVYQLSRRNRARIIELQSGRSSG